MRITRLVLHGYRNLALSMIKEIDVQLDSLLQLILGTNGSGKSSLLRQLNPMPISPGDFTKEGYKEIHIEHQGKQYIGISKIHGRSAKHTFICDGQSLCEDAVAPVYKEHMERELNYTAELQKLLLQETHFTQMGPAQRQDVLMSISHLDLTYALGLYDRLRTGQRDTTGAIKHLETKIESLHRELGLIEDRELAAQRYNVLEQAIFALRPHSLNEKVDMSRYSERVLRVRDELLAYIQQAKDVKSVSTNGLRSYGAALERRAGLTEQYHQLEGEARSVLVQLDELNKHKAMVENTDAGTDRLRRELNEIETSLEKMGSPKAIDVSVELIRPMHYVSKALYEIAIDYPDQYQPCDRATLLTQQDTCRALATEHLKANEQLKVEQERLIHAEHHRSGALTCPNCSTKVYPARALDDAGFSALVDTVEALGKRAETLSMQLTEQESILTGYRNYVQVVNRIKRVLDAEPAIMDYLQTLGYVSLVDIEADLRTVVDRLDRDRRTLEAQANYQTLIKRKLDIEGTLKTIEDAGRLDVQGQASALEARYEDILKLQRTLQVELNDTKSLITVFETLTALHTEIEAAVGEAGEAFADYGNAIGYQGVEEQLKTLEAELYGISERVNKAKHLEDHIERLEGDVKELRGKREAYSLLLNELSPKDGFIAEQMQGFINDFVSQMNRVIGAIWEYDLSVLPCGIEKGKLDYKFPVRVEDEVVPDIGLTSKGQQEVINFAFTVVLLAYKGLNQYPLFLDEVGAAFDHTHRGRFMQYVKHMLDTRQCEQLFMVNHFSSEYGGLANADTLVLSPQNIVVPRDYNNHATLRYY